MCRDSTRPLKLKSPIFNLHKLGKRLLEGQASSHNHHYMNLYQGRRPKIQFLTPLHIGYTFQYSNCTESNLKYKLLEKIQIYYICLVMNVHMYFISYFNKILIKLRNFLCLIPPLKRLNMILSFNGRIIIWCS